MTTTAVAETKKEKPYSQVMNEREEGLLNCTFTLEEFSKHVEVSYDNRWRAHEWRVRGDVELYYWIHDVRQSRDEETLSEAQIIEIAYQRLQTIRARKGQVNSCGVYVKDSVAEIIPRKKMEYAKVYYVQDCVDKTWHWATDYWVGAGGGSGPISLGRNTVENKDAAIIAGATYLKTMISKGYEFQQGNKAHTAFVRKLDEYIGDYKAQIIQPSLFW